MKKALSIVALLCSAVFVYAQEEQVKQEDYYELSLEDLMNIPINSASKKDETLFDAPLSSYTITKSDIEKSGATSIMEALRLAPGVIVREQTNGNYDIHIRGFDNLLGYSSQYSKSNLTTLVMINDRPVFNNNLGGTFWEALSIDVNDVERIEIVRGPSAPLFGPNAVTGVINIITKKFTEKTMVNASVQYGSPATLLANATVGSKVNEKFQIGASANYQKRERFDDLYYNQATGVYGPTAATVQYPDQNIAMDKYGVNAFASYAASEKLSFDLTLGAQESQVQKAFIGTTSGSPLTTNTTRSQSANLQAKIYGLNVRTSYLNGKDDLNFRSAPNRYDQQVVDFVAEYEVKVSDNINIVPGISYQYVNFGDADYVADGAVFLAGKDVTIKTSSAFIRTDIKATKNLRIIAAGRADKFSLPDDVYFAYEFASTYKINSKNLIRAAITQSNSGSFIGNNFLDLNILVPNGAGPGITINYMRQGNNDMKLFTVNMMELGYRSQLSKNLQLDLDVFLQQAKNMNALIFRGPDGTFTGTYPNVIERFEDIDTKAKQTGATLSLNMVPSEKIQFKPFLTVQKTTLEKAYTGFNLSASIEDRDHENTPSIYGGYYLNFKASDKLNINSSAYLFGSQRQYDVTDPNNDSDAGNIKGKFLMNLKVNYALTSDLSVFLNARNLLNADSYEFYGADKTGGLYMAGLSFNLN
jgi:iron complex outermembrane recepter protein